MTELFDEDELVEEETIPVLDNAVAVTKDGCTLDARRRLENKLANKRLESELDDLADYT